MERVAKRLDQKKIALRLTERATERLAVAGYDPAFGARPLKRVIQNEILDELALRIVEGKIGEGSNVTIDYKDGWVITT